MLELYHWEPNGSALKPLIAMFEKELGFRSHYVDVLSFAQYSPEFLATDRETRLPLEGEGPVLIHDGHQITESFFITEYLEDAFPEVSLRPAEPFLQAKILAWGRFINEVLMPAVSTLGCHAYFAQQLKGRDPATLMPNLDRIPTRYLRDGWRSALTHSYSADLIDDSRRKVVLAVGRLESALSGAAWLVGNTYSLSDIDAFAICNSLPALLPDLVSASATPNFWQWLTRIRTRAAVREALALSRTGRPELAFAPGPEHSRWG